MTIPTKSNIKKKQPVSVLVVLHTPDNLVLLLERKDKAGFWQSVTGSVELGETLAETAHREVKEETGIELATGVLHNWQQQTVYEIYPHWRHRYADGITHNTEHTFSACITKDTPIVLSEHTQYRWLPIEEAAQLASSPSNQQAILALKQF